MFWGCFSYDKKGPCHIWKSETAQKRKAAQKQINKLSEEIEPALRAKWELNQSMERLRIRRNVPGPKPKMKDECREWSFCSTEGQRGY
jgi:hypothetical protein